MLKVVYKMSYADRYEDEEYTVTIDSNSARLIREFIDEHNEFMHKLRASFEGSTHTKQQWATLYHDDGHLTVSTEFVSRVNVSGIKAVKDAYENLRN